MSALESFLKTGDLKFLINPRKNKYGFISRTLSGPDNLTEEQKEIIRKATQDANDVIKTQIQNNVWAYSYDLLNLTHIPSSALEISEKLGSLRKEIFNLKGPAGVFGVLATLLDFFTPFLKFTALTIPYNIANHFYMIVTELGKNFFLPYKQGRGITFIMKGQSIIMVILIVQAGIDSGNLTRQIYSNKDIYPPNKLTNGLDFSRNTVKIIAHATTESLPYIASNSNVPLFASALDGVDNLIKPVNNYVVQPALEHLTKGMDAAAYGVANCINDIALSTQTILFETGSSLVDFASSWNFLSNQTAEQKQQDFLEKSECLKFLYKDENRLKINEIKIKAPEIFGKFVELDSKMCIKCIQSLLDQSIALTDFDIYKKLEFPILSNSTEAIKGVINNLMQIKNIRNPPVPEDFSSSVNKLAIFNLLEIKSGAPKGHSVKVVGDFPPNLNVKDELLKLSNERLIGLQNTLAAYNSMDELQTRLKVWVDKKIASKTYTTQFEISELNPEGLAELKKALKNLATTKEITELTNWIDNELIRLQKVNVTNDHTLYLSSDKTIHFFVPVFDDSSSPYEANVNLEQQTELTPVDGFDFSTRFDIFNADTMLVNTQFDPSAYIEDMFTNNSAGEAVTWMKDKVMINYFNKVGNPRTKLSKKIQEEAVAELKDGIYNNLAQSLPNMWKTFTTGAVVGSYGGPLASVGLGIVSSLYEPLANYASNSYKARQVDPEAAANEFMNIVNTHGILSGTFDETTKASIEYFDNKLSGFSFGNTKILHEWIYQLTLAGLEKFAGNVAEYQDEKGTTQFIVSEQTDFTWFLNSITRMFFSVSSDGFGGNNWWINVYNKPSVFWYAYSHLVSVFGGMAYFTSMVHQIFIFNSLMTYVLYWIHRTLYPTIFCNLSYSVQRGLKITLAKENPPIQNFNDVDLEAIIIVITAFERNSFSPKKDIKDTLKRILTNLEPLTAVRPENDQKWHAFTTYTLSDFNLKLLFDPIKNDNYRFHVGTSILNGSTVQSKLTEKTKFELFLEIIQWNYNTPSILFCDYTKKSVNFEQLILQDEMLKTEGQKMFIFFGCPKPPNGCTTAPRTVKITSDQKIKISTKYYRLVVVIDDKGTVYELLNQVWYKFKNTDDKGHVPEKHQAAGRHQENNLYLEKDRTYAFCVYKYMHIFNTNRKTREYFFREKIEALLKKMDTENENGTQLQHIHDETIRLQHSYEHPLCEFATFAIAVPGNVFKSNADFKKKIQDYKDDMIQDEEFIQKCKTLQLIGLPTMTDLNKVSTEDPLWIIRRLAFKNNCNLKIYCIGRDTETYNIIKSPTRLAAELKTKAKNQTIPVVSNGRKLRSSKVQAPDTLSENEVLTNPEAKEPTADIPTIHIGVIIKDLQVPYNHFFPSFEPSNNETIPGIVRDDLNAFLKYYTDSVSPSYIQNIRTYLQEKGNSLFNLASRYLLNSKENNS